MERQEVNLKNDSGVVAFLASELRNFVVPQMTPSWQVSIFPTLKPGAESFF